MVSEYLTDTVVEIAFNAGFTTDPAARVWTDVSAWVEGLPGLDIGVGRSSERASADANTLTVVLDNSDGRFTAGRAASPYYPNVRIHRPIRVTATPAYGSPMVRFSGYINQWPVEWDGGVSTYAKATVTASSQLALLGFGSEFFSIVEEEILFDATGPECHYWPLSEASGATFARDVTGVPAVDLFPRGSLDQVDVVFGNATGPGTDGLTAAEFAANAKRLQSDRTLGQTDATKTIYMECYFNVPPGSANKSLMYLLQSANNPDQVAFALDVKAGQVRAATIQTTSVVNICGTLGAGYDDGRTHHVAATLDCGTKQVVLYVDGLAAASMTASGAGAFVFDPSVYLGLTGDPAGPSPLVLAHALVWVGATPSPITPDRTLVHALAGLTGFAGEPTLDRLRRYLRLARVSTSLLDVEAPASAPGVAHVDTTGKNLVDMARVVEQAEGGTLYDTAAGSLRLRNRSSRYQAPVAVTLSMADQQVEADYAPRVDRSALLNDVTVTSVADGQVVRFFDAASRDEYGVSRGTDETTSTETSAASDRAGWLVNLYKQPAPRVPSVTIDLLAFDAITRIALLGLTLGDQIAIVGQPTQAAEAASRFFVEGYAEHIGHASHTLTLNLSPALLYAKTLVLDSPTRGVLDANVIGY